MRRNIELPAALAASVVSHFKNGASATLEACTAIARAYSAHEDGAWDQEQFLSFFDRLATNKIGKGRSEFLKEDSKGIVQFKFKSPGVYFQMQAVGECAAFQTREFKAAIRTSSYSTLYRLTVLYNQIADRKTGKPEKNQERAQKAVMDLVTQHGAELTRLEVDEAIKKSKQDKRSHAPQNPSEEVQAAGIPGSKATIQDLLDREERYDLVVITPDDTFLREAEQSSPSTLLDRAPYQELRSEGSKTVLIGSGSQRAGLQRLAELSSDVTYSYCVRSAPDASAVIDLAKEKLIFSSHPLDCSAKPAKGENVDEFVKRLINGSAAPNARKLHLFANQAREGWDTCDAPSSVKDQ